MENNMKYKKSFKWIDFQEKKPCDIHGKLLLNKKYIIYSPYSNKIHMGWYDPKKQEFLLAGRPEILPVSHWSELPEKPLNTK